MVLSEVEAQITAVLKSLSDTPRTIYEVENLYQLNVERIAAARAALADMSGDYVDQLRARCTAAEAQAVAKHAAGVVGTAEVDNAFSLDFAMDDAAEENAAEVERAKMAAGGGGGHHKRAGKKNGAKTKSKKSKDASKEGVEADKAGESAAVSFPSPAPQVVDQTAGSTEKAAAAAAGQPKWVVLDRQEDLPSGDLPAALTASGRGRCEPVTNSPLARLLFTSDVDWDGTTCHCAVELYRCVVVALTYGEPQLSWVECQKLVQAQMAAGVSTGKGTVSKGTSAASAAGPAPAPTATQGSEDGDGDEEASDESADDLTLSEQLVAEYEQAQRAEAEQDLATSTIPCEVTERLQQRLRTFTNEVWVVLLCHGGYFAGGVFVNGRCLLHKAFQRYVVRKKQGGKQSSNAKDTGSYNSVGSQIRAAQEVRWRVDVRDILLEWTPYIHAAAFILYAAPGPQNRAVLTDFSLLPAVAGLGGSKGTSPIQLKDRRVSRVPITTHRPNFEEVQRIYNVCSHCSLLYITEEEDAE